MNIFLENLTLTTLSWEETLLRIALALLFGFLIGYDRNKKNKPVDFRVYMVVASTTCMLAIMGLELVAIYDAKNEHIDLGIMRIVQGVLTGIGFLGAGAIMSRGDNQITGMTTGASIWSSGSMGMMLGFGLYGLAIFGFSILLAILVILGLCKKPLFDESDKEIKNTDINLD